MSSLCFSGRIIVRHDQFGGLDWSQPCPVPAENTLETEPPMYFCSPHMAVVAGALFEVFDRAGVLDDGVVAAPPDELDRMLEGQRRSEQGE